MQGNREAQQDPSKQASRNASATEDKSLYKVYVSHHELFCEDQKEDTAFHFFFTSQCPARASASPQRQVSSLLHALYSHLWQDKMDIKKVYRIRMARLRSKLPPKLSFYGLAKALVNVQLGLPSHRQKYEQGD